MWSDRDIGLVYDYSEWGVVRVLSGFCNGERTCKQCNATFQSGYVRFVERAEIPPISYESTWIIKRSRSIKSALDNLQLTMARMRVWTDNVTVTRLQTYLGSYLCIIVLYFD